MPLCTLPPDGEGEIPQVVLLYSAFGNLSSAAGADLAEKPWAPAQGQCAAYHRSSHRVRPILRCTGRYAENHVSSGH
jgi:hypothetical protein